jgi:hypothetical protein
MYRQFTHNMALKCNITMWDNFASHDLLLQMWFLTLREEHMLQVFENSTLRKTFDLRWRSELDNSVHHTTKNICNFYRSPHIKKLKCKMLQWDDHVAEMERQDMLTEKENKKIILKWFLKNCTYSFHKLHNMNILCGCFVYSFMCMIHLQNYQTDFN